MNAALRKRVAAIVAKAAEPLPAGDPGILEAMRRLAAIESLHRDNDLRGDVEKEVGAQLDPIASDLEDRILEASPQTDDGIFAMIRYAVHSGYRFSASDPPVVQVAVLFSRLVA